MNKPKSIDEYLKPLDHAQRTALEKLRKDIEAAAPNAQECISYGVPGFRLNGQLLVSFGAAAKHCSFYPGSYPIEANRAELKKYETSKGTIRFSAVEPLPSTLVRKLVKSRIGQQAAKSKQQKKAR
jgi:uncharacterized protein YdhG (YjbR/CyaY superfamily)